MLLPDDTEAFFEGLEAGEEPNQTVVFFNHYRPGEIYPNQKGTLTLQLAVPASGKGYGLSAPLVRREKRRTEEAIGLPGPWRATSKSTSFWTRRTSPSGGAWAGPSTGWPTRSGR